MKIFIGLLLITVTTATPLYSLCGLGPGEDMCQKKDCNPLVVRPMELPKPVPLPDLKLTPIKGPCSCHTTLVKPAIVPKPKCVGCKRITCTCSDQQHHLLNQESSIDYMVGGSTGCDNAGAILQSQPIREVIVPSLPSAAIYEVNDQVPVPADAVSVQLAYNLAQEACTKSEDKLSFGFRTLPKEIPQIAKKVNNVPEEKLFKLNGQIVELKKIPCSDTKTVEEEAAEDLADLEEEERGMASGAPKLLTLGEVGYGPAKIKSAPFVDVKLDSSCSTPDKSSDNAGFVPGAVVVAELPKLNGLSVPKRPPYVPCEVDLLKPPLPIPSAIDYVAQSQSSSSSSSSSCCSNSNRNILFQHFALDDDIC